MSVLDAIVWVVTVLSWVTLVCLLVKAKLKGAKWTPPPTPPTTTESSGVTYSPELDMALFLLTQTPPPPAD